MIAKYNNEYYHTGLPKANMMLWKFIPIEKLMPKSTINHGYATCCKEVFMSDIQELFAITFSVEWNGKTFIANLADDNHVSILLPEKEKLYALSQMFEKKTEIDAWERTIPIAECTGFFVTKMFVYPHNLDKIIPLTKEDWVKYNKQLKEEAKMGV